MSRIGIYTKRAGPGFTALVPSSDLIQTFGWTQQEAINVLAPYIHEYVYRCRSQGKKPANGWESLPKGDPGELTFITV